MAGIAFEIRRVLKPNSLFGLFYALSYGVALSAGPIIISIFLYRVPLQTSTQTRRS